MSHRGATPALLITSLLVVGSLKKILKVELKQQCWKKSNLLVMLTVFVHVSQVEVFRKDQ